jgi:hypothetical protein
MPALTKALMLLLASLPTLLMIACSPSEKVQVLSLHDAWVPMLSGQDTTDHTALNATVERIKIRSSGGMSILKETSTAYCRIDDGYAVPGNPSAEIIHLMFDAWVNDPQLKKGDRVRLWFNPEGQFRALSKIKAEGDVAAP